MPSVGARVLTAGKAPAVPPYQARHSPLELLAIVRVVSLHVDPDTPHTVSGRRWDDGRAGAGHPQAPLAFSIAKRLAVAWPDLLRVAHLPPELAWRRLAHLQSDKGRKGVTLDGVLLALRQAALRVDKPGVDRTDYRRARGEMLAASERTRHGRTAARAVPELTQIEEILGRNGLTWEQGLQRAGLSSAHDKNQRAASYGELARGFIDQFDQLPRNYSQLRRWAAARQISFPLAGKGSAQLAASAISEIVQQRDVAGNPALPIAPSELSFANTSGQFGLPARIRTWDREKLISGMALAVGLLGPATRLDQRSLKRIAAERRDLPIPSYSTVNRHLRPTPPRRDLGAMAPRSRSPRPHYLNRVKSP
jgi:hypothetical protein